NRQAEHRLQPDNPRLPGIQALEHGSKELGISDRLDDVDLLQCNILASVIPNCSFNSSTSLMRRMNRYAICKACSAPMPGQPSARSEEARSTIRHARS